VELGPQVPVNRKPAEKSDARRLIAIVVHFAVSTEELTMADIIDFAAAKHARHPGESDPATRVQSKSGRLVEADILEALGMICFLPIGMLVAVLTNSLGHPVFWIFLVLLVLFAVKIVNILNGKSRNSNGGYGGYGGGAGCGAGGVGGGGAGGGGGCGGSGGGACGGGC
jgi:uncharacterized membrane protein YgcG